MNIVILVKLVPDLVEELTIDTSGVALDTAWLRMIINEFDDHAIEQGILLKERGGGNVTVVAPDIEGVDDVLFTAAAKGADQIDKDQGRFYWGKQPCTWRAPFLGNCQGTSTRPGAHRCTGQ